MIQIYKNKTTGKIFSVHYDNEQERQLNESYYKINNEEINGVKEVDIEKKDFSYIS